MGTPLSAGDTARSEASASPEAPGKLGFLSISCSWCHESNVVSSGLPTWCKSCGHRGDLPRAFCDCRQCVDAILDARFVHQAMQKWAPDKSFGELDPETQSRILQHAQELKLEARR